jgi:hypothetical protein
MPFSSELASLSSVDGWSDADRLGSLDEAFISLLVESDIRRLFDLAVSSPRGVVELRGLGLVPA